MTIKHSWKTVKHGSRAQDQSGVMQVNLLRKPSRPRGVGRRNSVSEQLEAMADALLGTADWVGDVSDNENPIVHSTQTPSTLPVLLAFRESTAEEWPPVSHWVSNDGRDGGVWTAGALGIPVRNSGHRGYSPRTDFNADEDCTDSHPFEGFHVDTPRWKDYA